jgi:NADH dehydrogenase
VKVLDHPETAGQTIECAGPEVMQLSEIVRLAGVWSGHPRPVASLPLGLGYPQALLMELLPGTPLMSRDNVSSMKIPNVASGKLPGLQSLGITPSAMSSVMPDVLGHRLGPARLEAWRTPGPR